MLKGRFGFNQGFAVYDDEMPTSKSGSAVAEPERRAGEVVDRAVKWLDTQSGKPFFLWVHVYDPHIPYDPPDPFREKYRDRPYDGEIAYTDQQLGRLFDTVARKSRPENTLIAVLSDHGESFSEHGEYTHGVFLYDTTLRIAFLMAGARYPRGSPCEAAGADDRPAPDSPGVDGGQGAGGNSGNQSGAGVPRQRSSDGVRLCRDSVPQVEHGLGRITGDEDDTGGSISARQNPNFTIWPRIPAETTNVIASHAAEAQELEAQLKAVSGGTEKVARRRWTRTRCSNSDLSAIWAALLRKGPN